MREKGEEKEKENCGRDTERSVYMFDHITPYILIPLTYIDRGLFATTFTCIYTHTHTKKEHLQWRKKGKTIDGKGERRTRGT